MKMPRRSFSLMLRTVFVLFLLTQVIHSNPLLPMPIITEIQVIDPEHWTIEMSVDGMGLGHGTPGSTDSIVLCTDPEYNGNLEEFLKESVKPVEFDDKSIALITPEHFPGQKIEFGTTIYYGVLGTEMVDEVEIWDELTAEVSLVRSSRRTCCEYYLNGTTNPQCRSYCNTPFYIITSCHSLGLENENGFGAINGTLLGANGDPLPQVNIFCNTSETNKIRTSAISNENGAFALSVDTCTSYLLTFNDLDGKTLVDTVVGPLQFDQNNKISIDVQLDYISVSNSLERLSSKENFSPVIHILPSGSAFEHVIVITISGSIPTAVGKCELFSLDGSLVQSLPFTYQGPGTYTLQWNQTGKRATVAYICRVRIGEKQWSRRVSFSNRRSL